MTASMPPDFVGYYVIIWIVVLAAITAAIGVLYGIRVLWRRWFPRDVYAERGNPRKWQAEQGRRDGYVGIGLLPPVGAHLLSPQEHEEAAQVALEELGCTYDQLADMAAKGRFESVDHRVAWVMFKRLDGGR